MKSILVKIKQKMKSLIEKAIFGFKNKTVKLGKKVQIIGINKLEVGNNVFISDNCWININNRDLIDTNMFIGNNCFIGRNNFFTVGKKIEINDYFFSSIDCKFIASSHEPNPYNAYIFNKTESKNSIKIGVNCFIGAGVTIIGNVNIGYGSIIGANTIVTKDIPPFSMVIGNPMKIIKRYNFQTNSWINIEKIDNIDFPNENEYLKMLDDKKYKLNGFDYAKSESTGWL